MIDVIFKTIYIKFFKKLNFIKILIKFLKYTLLFAFCLILFKLNKYFKFL